jgi:hypothetical protein
MKFWVPWSFAAIATALAVFFFLAGRADGTVSSFNIVLWLWLLAVTVGVTGASLWLRRAGRTGLAILLTLVLAVPGLLAGLFALLVIVTHPRWN